MKLVNRKSDWLIAAILLTSTSCANGSTLTDTELDNLISFYFPDPEVSESLKCILDSDDGNIEHCEIKGSHLNYRNTSYDNSPTLLQFVLAREDTGQFSPEKFRHLVGRGADPSEVAGTIISNYELEYFKALVEVVGGPNGLADGDWFPGSIMHATIAYWQDDKVEYLIEQGVNLEERSPETKETAILVARYSRFETSEFSKINKLLDYGADPHAKDKWGRDICEFVRNGRSLWDKKFPDQRLQLSDRLRKEYGIDCKISSQPSQ